MQTIDLETHDIYAGNVILGQALICGLRLPAHWQLAKGVSHPEVTATHERRNRKWIVTGDAWYVVFDGDRRWALELAIRVRPVSQRQLPAGKVSSVSGHPAAVVWKTRRRGLPWRRHDVTFMTVHFTCPPSERRLSLEFSGWCPPEGFQEVLAAVQQLKCH